MLSNSPTVCTTLTVDQSPSPPLSSETCEAQQEISDATKDSPIGSCEVTLNCSTLICSTSDGNTADLELLPCNDPPGIHVIFFDTDNNVVYDEILTETTTIPLGANSLVLYITQLPDGIGIKVCIQYERIPTFIIVSCTPGFLYYLYYYC